jgi:hypothetical protein
MLIVSKPDIILVTVAATSSQIVPQLSYSRTVLGSVLEIYQEMNSVLEFVPCSFCELIEVRLEERELDPEEEINYRHHMRVAHGMTV